MFIVINGAFKNIGGFFILAWLGGWTTGGIFAFRFFLWNLKGREIITVGQGQIAIRKKAMLFSKPKSFDLNEVKNIRVRENYNDGNLAGFRFRGQQSGQGGTIVFDYGLQSVKFAEGLSEAEGNYILKQLRDNRFLTDRNFIPG